MSLTKVRDIMSSSLVWVDPNDTLAHSLEIMQEREIRHIPVLQNGKLVGLLSQRDLYHATLGSVMHYGERAEHTFLASVRVKEVMTEPPIITISAETPLREAARQMADDKIGCLPVIENEKVIGLITKTDVLRAFAQGKTG